MSDASSSLLPPPLQRVLPSARNVAAAYLGTVVEAGVFLLLTPFLVRQLGLAEFGLWAIAVAVTDWLQLLDLGLREAVMKYAASHQARAEARQVREVAETALVIHLLAGAVALLLGLALGWLLLPSFVSSDGDLSVLRTAFLLLLLSTAVSLPANMPGTLLEGLSRFDLLNLFRMGHSLLRLVLVVLALQFDWGVVGVAMAELTARMALHAARWTALRRLEPRLLPMPRLHPGWRGRLLDFGFWNGLRQISEVILAKVYEPLLALLSGLPAVGAFYLGRRLGSMPAEAIVPLASVLFPLSAELEAAGRSRALRDTFLTSTKVATAAALPLAMVLGFGAGPILFNWQGGRAAAAEPVLEAFAAVFLVVAATLPSEVILLGLGSPRLLALLGLGQGVLTIALGIPLTLRFGPAGLALGALIAVTALQGGVQLPIAARCAGVPMREVLRRGLLPPVAAAVPVALALALLETRVATGGLAALFAWSGGGVMAYASLIWFIGFDAHERAFLRRHAQRLIQPQDRIRDWGDAE